MPPAQRQQPRELQQQIYFRQQIGLLRVLLRNSTTAQLRTNPVMLMLFCPLLKLQTYHVDMKLSLPKCNFRMAQGTQCLHAIRNYMRKVMLKYQHVHPAPPTLFNFFACWLIHYCTYINCIFRFCVSLLVELW